MSFQLRMFYPRDIKQMYFRYDVVKKHQTRTMLGLNKVYLLRFRSNTTKGKEQRHGWPSVVTSFLIIYKPRDIGRRIHYVSSMHLLAEYCMQPVRGDIHKQSRIPFRRPQTGSHIRPHNSTLNVKAMSLRHNLTANQRRCKRILCDAVIWCLFYVNLLNFQYIIYV